MLRIRRAQQEVFGAAEVADFERRAMVHLRRFFPSVCASLADPELLDITRRGIERAASYGVVGERDVTLYLNLMMTLGQDFDRDPGLAWARAILVDPELPEPERRMRRLYRAAIEREEASP